MKKISRTALGLAVSCIILAALAAPALAQFEEADTMPRFAAGIFFDLNFRGSRGQTVSGVKIDFTNSPAGGLRLDYRITGTLALGVFGSYTRVQEKLTDVSGDIIIGTAHFNIFQFGGELALRVKPQIPGYFLLGGGAQLVQPAGDDPAQITGTDSFTEPFGIVGAGYEFASTRKRAFRINFRLFLVNPSDQGGYEPKSIEVDFVVGAAFILRF